MSYYCKICGWQWINKLEKNENGYVEGNLVKENGICSICEDE